METLKTAVVLFEQIQIKTEYDENDGPAVKQEFIPNLVPFAVKEEDEAPPQDHRASGGRKRLPSGRRVGAETQRIPGGFTKEDNRYKVKILRYETIPDINYSGWHTIHQFPHVAKETIIIAAPAHFTEVIIMFERRDKTLSLANLDYLSHIPVQFSGAYRAMQEAKDGAFFYDGTRYMANIGDMAGDARRNFVTVMGRIAEHARAKKKTDLFFIRDPVLEGFRGGKLKSIFTQADQPLLHLHEYVTHAASRQAAVRGDIRMKVYPTSYEKPLRIRHPTNNLFGDISSDESVPSQPSSPVPPSPPSEESSPSSSPFPAPVYRVQSKIPKSSEPSSSLLEPSTS